MRNAWIAKSMVALTFTVVAGCQSSSSDGGGILRAGIPPKAQKVQEGSGQLTYLPDRAGRIFLYDVGNDQVVERYQVRKGQRFAVDAGAGRATLEGNEVSVGKLKEGNTYRIFFLPDDAG